jgi:hypothetical protein
MALVAAPADNPESSEMDSMGRSSNDSRSTVLAAPAVFDWVSARDASPVGSPRDGDCPQPRTRTWARIKRHAEKPFLIFTASASSKRHAFDRPERTARENCLLARSLPRASL